VEFGKVPLFPGFVNMSHLFGLLAEDVTRDHDGGYGRRASWRVSQNTTERDVGLFAESILSPSASLRTGYVEGLRMTGKDRKSVILSDSSEYFSRRISGFEVASHGTRGYLLEAVVETRRMEPRGVLGKKPVNQTGGNSVRRLRSGSEASRV
jgi:hypothetical protein